MQRIETDVLKQASVKLATLKDQFDGEVAKLYAEIENLSVSYQGQASSTFNAKIEGYRVAFTQLSQLVSSYSEYLANVAENTEMTESAVLEAANKLVTLG